LHMLGDRLDKQGQSPGAIDLLVFR
jgi:hypothetical protein